VGALLQVSDLVVDFDGFRAIDGLDLAVDEGELRFLIGPNGAGKTTLVDVVTGLTRATEGTVHVGGRPIGGLAPHEIVGLGIGRTFQAPAVFEELTVADNVDLAARFREPLRSSWRRRRGVDAHARSVIERVGLAGSADSRAASLSHGQKQWLEIAMLLAQGSRLLLLDEPVAGMSAEERARTGELLVGLAATRTVVVIEHDMDFVRRYASKVTVLHEGRTLCEGSVAAVRDDPVVREVYLGRSRDSRNAMEVD
jgi:urea transport system ATP-binding protein